MAAKPWYERLTKRHALALCTTDRDRQITSRATSELNCGWHPWSSEGSMDDFGSLLVHADIDTQLFRASEFTLPAARWAYPRMALLILRALQPMRHMAGGPLIIRSSYRTPSYNAAHGGASRSAHMYNCACDIRFGRLADAERAYVWLAAQWDAGEPIGVGVNARDQVVHVDYMSPSGRRRWRYDAAGSPIKWESTSGPRWWQ